MRTYQRMTEKMGGSYRAALTGGRNNTNTSTRPTLAPAPNTPVPTPAPAVTPFVKRSDRLKQALQSSQDKVKTLLKWTDRNKDGCALHPNAEVPHKFLECHHVRNICNDCEAIEALATAIAEGDSNRRNREPSGDGAGNTHRARRTVTAEQLNDMVQARRANAGNESNNGPTETDYETDNTSSTVGDNNNTTREPYLSQISSSYLCRKEPPQSILRTQNPRSPPASNNSQVSFSPEVTKQQLLKSNESAHQIWDSGTSKTCEASTESR